MGRNDVLVQENERIKQEFEGLGLELDDVWYPTPDDPVRENRTLHLLLRWVRAYRQTPGRRPMERRGYQFPPVSPDCDPDSDWIRFERWINHEPVSWRADELVGRLTPAEQLTDEELRTALERVEKILATRGVVIDLCGGIPDRVAYEYLRESLADSEFEFMGPATTCHLDGCTGYCPGCFQRPWCATGRDEAWPEDLEESAA